MRSICLLFCFALFVSKAVAQLPPDNFILFPGGKEIKAETFVTGTGSKKSSLLIYFIPDSIHSPALKTAIDQLRDSLHGNFVILQMHFEKPADSNATAVLHSIANDLVNVTLPDLKKFKGLSTENVIVAGANEGAVLALYTAAASKGKIKRTGMFISGYEPFTALKNETDSLGIDVDGKLYVYNHKQKAEDISADDFCDALALRDGLLIFKADEDDDADVENALEEFVRWVEMEGSNYVFSVE